MNRFMELFRCNARSRKDVVAPDFEALRRQNYARDDDQRAAGVEFWRIAQRAAARARKPALRLVPGAAPANREDRG